MRRVAARLLLIAFLFYPVSAAFAWGEIGHFLIALVASKVVETPELKTFLKNRGLMLGHLSNIPDIMWRDNSDKDKIGENSHFLNPGETALKDLPVSWKEVVERFKKSPAEVATDLGSLWWRAEQFQRLATQNATEAKSAKPEGPKYTKAVYGMIVNMGLLAHFIGDASMPWHNSSDYNGWKIGHGGIHDYYEGLLVEALGLDLAEKVRKRVEELKEERQKDSSATLVEKMKVLSVFSSGQIPALVKLDKVSAPSVEETKTKATRPPPEDNVKKFGPYIIDQLARSSLVLAETWDQMYAEGGKPDLTGYHSWTYPLAPPYVPVDYVGPDGAPCSVVAKLAPKKTRATRAKK